MRIYVRVIPRASRNEVVQTGEGEYKVKITASPVGGAANDMLVRILASHFGVARSLVTIAGGKSSRVKMIDISMI